MIHKFKYILSLLLLVSLIGLGENIFDSIPKVKYIKETELVGKTNLKEKESKCFNYYQHLFDLDAIVNIATWSSQNILFYKHKISVEFIFLRKISCEIDLIDLIINKPHTPRKSIENYTTYC